MSDKVMPANILRNELREILAGAHYGGPEDDGWDDEELTNASDAILSAIQARLPKEKDSDDSKRYTAQDKPSAEWGYNTCLAEVKEALDLGERK